ncbi:MAG: N-acetylmuramoyl-L-alanine amidase [Eubacterium sp.]|nr:N-acetylmuramoyl-L-alanine amidase [Eubacterium sp.]
MKTVKTYKFIYILMMMLLIVSFSACGGKKDKGSKEKDDSREADSITTEEKNAKVDSSVINDDTLGTRVDSFGFAICDDYVVTADNFINIRKEPNTDSEIYMVLMEGVDLHRTGTREGWTRVKLNGSNYYVSSNLVQETKVKWATPQDAEKVTHTVFIDPAKQIKALSEEEAIAPDSDKKKPQMAASNIGVSTGNFEYELMLDLAVRLKAELTKRGFTVILSRDSSTVEISNRDRALMAASSKAEVYIKLQAGKAAAETEGFMGFILPKAKNAGLYDKSNRLCEDMLSFMTKGTGKSSRGIVKTDGLTSLNYCTVPAVVINTGFLSNEADDKALSDNNYQADLAKYMADGIEQYFKETDEESK